MRARSGPAQAALVDHQPDLVKCEADSGFGSLLFDSRGRLVLDSNGGTWLYTTTRRADGEWFSQARRLDIDDWTLGAPVTVLVPGPNDVRAVVHLVIRLSAERYLALYSNGKGLGAASASRPDGAFEVDRDFFVGPEDAWELGDRLPEDVSLEANGALVFNVEDRDRLAVWVGYDSYHPGALRGELGWLTLIVDKADGRIRAWRRHHGNPLPFLAEGEICARCGGNLDSRTRICGYRAFFYYARKDRKSLAVKLALARDPLFLEPTWLGHLDGPLGDEEVVEKFQAFEGDNSLCLIYESRHKSGLWRTGVRRYRSDRLASLIAEALVRESR